jgi:hypothetical protein
MNCDIGIQTKSKKLSKIQRFRDGLCSVCNTFAMLTRFKGDYFCMDCFLRYDSEAIQRRLEELIYGGEHPLARLERGEDGDGLAFRKGKRKGGNK